MTKTEETGRTTDPFEVWRQLYDSNERTWSAALEQAMGSPEFGESSGKLLETMLAAQKSVRDNMRTYLETMNVPTREDIARLGELVIGLEEKIDQVVDRLDGIEGSVRDNVRTYREMIQTLNVPTRADIARVGELVVGLEKKIDRRHATEDAARAKAAASAKAATARAAARAKAATARAKAATARAKAAKAATAKAATAKAATAKAAK
jgi:predicted HicB family RNase H-like nuclease